MDSSALPDPKPEIPAPKLPRILPPQFADPILREQNRQIAAATPRISPRPLTIKQKRFLKFYLEDPQRNQDKAAILAGYSENNAREGARLNLMHPEIRRVIEETDRELYSRLAITKERVLQELSAIAYSRLPDYLTEQPDKDGVYGVDLSRIDAVQAAAIEEYTVERYGSTVKTKIKLYPKLEALTLMGRDLGLGFDSRTPSTQNNLALTINLLDSIVAGTASLPVSIEGSR